jgi:type I restriction enzyme M protein
LLPEAADFEDTIRRAIALGGDADTLAAIAGGIAGAYFGVPPAWQAHAAERLTVPMQAVVEQFLQTYGAR